MTFADEVAGIRGSAALTIEPLYGIVRVTGPAAAEAVEAISPRALFLRSGQILHTLLLDDDGAIQADLFIGRIDREYVLLADGVTGTALCAVLAAHAPQADAWQAIDLDATHDVISVNGPYAWELLAAVESDHVIGVPYLTSFELESAPGARAFRSGRTGEFGYEILIEKPSSAALIERIRERGRELDLVDATRDALELCALENGFFVVRGSSPIELQLQWRVDYDRDYLGAEALRRRRSEGVRRRSCLMVGPAGGQGVPTSGASLLRGGAPIGRVLHARHSPTLDRVVVLGLLDLRLAHPGVDAIEVADDPAAGALQTRSAPLLHNRSLFLDLQIHSYASRADGDFPDIVRGT
jgi:glycine cleavage system aminomethyltransferase T